jgi:hypothetical protein
MNVTDRHIPMATPQVMLLAQHSSGLHAEQEIDCPDCENDACESPYDFAPTNS